MRSALGLVVIAFTGACTGDQPAGSASSPTPSSTSSSASAASTSSMSGTASTAADAGLQTVDAGAPDAGPPPVLLVDGLRVDGISVFQSVQIPVVTGGAAVGARNAPIIAGKAALIRVSVMSDGSWDGSAVTARLVLVTGGNTQTLISVGVPQLPAQEANDQSFLPFNVPAAALAESTQFSVQLTSPAGHPAVDGMADPARYPVNGMTISLGVSSDPGPINLVLVPVRYDRDGSGRLPDTSPAQLDLIRSMLAAIYPAVQVDITVHLPLPWDNWLTLTGNVNFGSLNSALINLREDDEAPSGAYYYALISPANTYAAYCGGSCVTGQSYLVDDPEDGDIRVGGGMGYTGESSAWTLVHELGHLHGRAHAPCGVNSWDPDYPYLDASIGVWGHDARSQAMLDPDVFTDFMGYCEDNWVSDYTYRALDERIRAVNALPTQRPLPNVPALLLDQDHTGAWSTLGRVVLSSGTGRAGADVHLLDQGGTRLATVRSRILRRGDGTFTTMVPLTRPGTAWVELLDGVTLLPVRVSALP